MDLSVLLLGLSSLLFSRNRAGGMAKRVAAWRLGRAIVPALGPILFFN